MPRVLIAGFCTLPGPDRAGVQLQHVVRALVRHHTVDVLVLRHSDQAYVERFAGARLLRVPVPEGDLRAQVDAFRRALRRQLEGADYDIVHFRDGWSGVPILSVQERLRFATVFDVARSTMTEPALMPPGLAGELAQDEEQSLRGADMILAPTEPARRWLATEVDSERVHLVPPGVNVDQFDWDEPEQKGPPRVLYMGTLDPGRGVRVLLRAMLDVAAKSDAHLVLAGRAPREFAKSLKTAVHDLGLGDRVDFVGEIDHDDVPAYIAGATVCVAPGAVELSPRATALYPTKILEYMACRRAVVAPRRTTITMMMRDDQHGLLFEPGQPGHLAEQILRLLEDPKLRERLARAGYDLVRRMYTASGTRRELRKAYNWLATQSVWRDRFLEVLDELPTMDVPPGEAEAMSGTSETQSESDEMSKPRPNRFLEGDDDTGAIGGDVGEVTRVEEIPVPVTHAPVTASSPAAPPRRDEWVVDDARARVVAAPRAPNPDDSSESVERTPLSPPSARRPRTTEQPFENTFVAGELDVPARSREPLVDPSEVDVGGVFTAMTPLLGTEKPAGDDELPIEEATQIAVAPPPPSKPERRSQVRRSNHSEPDASLPPTDKHKPLDEP